MSKRFNKIYENIRGFKKYHGKRETAMKKFFIAVGKNIKNSNDLSSKVIKKTVEKFFPSDIKVITNEISDFIILDFAKHYKLKAEDFNENRSKYMIPALWDVYRSEHKI